jgi:hypothetical protein
MLRGMLGPHRRSRSSSTGMATKSFIRSQVLPRRMRIQRARARGAPPVASLTEMIVSRSYFNFRGMAAKEAGIAKVEYKTDQRHGTKFVPANETTSWKFKIRRDSYHSLRVVIRAINNEGGASPEMVIKVQP